MSGLVGREGFTSMSTVAGRPVKARDRGNGSSRDALLAETLALRPWARHHWSTGDWFESHAEAEG